MQGDALRGRVLVSLDRALELTRRAGTSELLGAMVPAALISLLCLGVYYVERVEGVRSLRPFFALALTGAYLARSLVLARWAGRRAEDILSAYRVEKPRGPAVGILRASLWVAFDLWFWLWLLVLAVHVDPWLVPLALPLFAVRGALLPTWLACADATPDASGFRILRRTVELSEGRRAQGVLAELLLLVAVLGLSVNLAALGAGAVSVGQEMLGLDLSLTNAFLSAKNHFALLFVLCAAFTLLEPLRAALSAVLFTESLLSREGIAVRSLVTRATDPAPRGARAGALAALLALACFAAPALAEEPAPTEQTEEPQIDEAELQRLLEQLKAESEGSSVEGVPAAEQAGQAVEGADEEQEEEVEVCEGACERAREADADIEKRTLDILQDRAFTEFPEEDWSMDAMGKNALSDWIRDLLERWLKEEREDPDQLDPSKGAPLALPSAGFFLVAAVVLLLIILVFVLVRGRNAPGEAALPSEEAEDPLKRPAEEHLQEAVSLSARDLSLALRSLYLATLVGLERRALLELSPERTNGQYLRTLPHGDDRRMFASFTRVFDAVHYGARVPTLDDFQTCRSLAEQLIAGASRP